MADISDVTAYLAGAVASAVYLNGTSQPSVANMDVRIFEGWPLPDQLDLDLAGKMMSSGTPPVVVARPGGPCANVSIYPMLGATATPFQIEDNTYVIVPPVYGMTPTVTVGAGGPAPNSPVTVTVAGQPNNAPVTINNQTFVSAEYLTAIIDRTYVFSATGSNTANRSHPEDFQGSPRGCGPALLQPA